MKKRKIIFSICVLLLLCMIVMYLDFYNPLKAFSEVARNQKGFEQQISEINDTPYVYLNNLTPFEWDCLYTFSPYLSKDRIEEIIGFKSDDIKETYSEGSVQLLFTNGDKVVCSICGNGDNFGYYFYWGDFQGFYFMLRSSDAPIFKVDNSQDIISLTYTK